MKTKFETNFKKTRGCWVWQGAKDRDGYGRFHVIGEKEMRAHRRAYVIYKGKIPKGKLVCHTCDNPSCVNPKHLFIGTALDNNRDAIKKGRAIKVKGEQHGMHKLTKENVKGIRILYSKGLWTQSRLARHFNISREMVGRIIRNQNWK